MAVIEPEMAILDETDSGLDIDALRIVPRASTRCSTRTCVLLITHYQRLLNHIKPDVVHVLGRAASSRVAVMTCPPARGGRLRHRPARGGPRDHGLR